MVLKTDFAATDDVWKTSLDHMDHVFIDMKTNRLSLPLILRRLFDVINSLECISRFFWKTTLNLCKVFLFDFV